MPVSASHAWVEVYFPGLGWVEFEPTSALDTFTRPAGDQSLAPMPPAAATPQTSQTGGAAAPLLAGLVLLAAAALALMILSARGRLAPDASLPPTSQQALALYRQVRWALSWAGLRAPPSHTPDEFMAACALPLENARAYGRPCSRQLPSILRPSSATPARPRGHLPRPPRLAARPARLAITRPAKPCSREEEGITTKAQRSSAHLQGCTEYIVTFVVNSL